MAWHLAPSLVQLQKELNKMYPGRPKDGTIGDQAHAARQSEHNPDNDPDPMPKGAVSAMDIYTGKVPSSLVNQLIKDPRTWYVIHKGYIYSRTHGFKKRKYTGSNPHTSHIHISLMQTKAAHDSKALWFKPLAVETYTVRPGDTLGEIADRFNTSVKKLLTLNPSIKDPDVISVGQKIRLS